jgi:hypothetical protein
MFREPGGILGERGGDWDPGGVERPIDWVGVSEVGGFLDLDHLDLGPCVGFGDEFPY